MRATQARLYGEAALPDSPQRREWQRGQTEAAAQLESIRDRVGSGLQDALNLLGSDKSVSDEWYDLADLLGRECRRLGGAMFCLHGWAELDDEHPDLDLDSPANWEIRRGVSRLFELDLKEVVRNVR